MKMKKKTGFTIIKNELLRPSQLTINARYLLMVLLSYCGQDDYCYPSQETLANTLNLSTRQLRTYLEELYENKLVYKVRNGYNKTNTYYASKDFNTYYLKSDGNSASPHIGSAYPLHNGNKLPTKNTYRIKKDKRIGLKETSFLKNKAKALAESKRM
jgi:hypothetical protein